MIQNSCIIAMFRKFSNGTIVFQKEQKSIQEDKSEKGLDCFTEPAVRHGYLRVTVFMRIRRLKALKAFPLSCVLK